MNRIRVVSFGLGPIGLAAAGLALKKRDLELVGAIDIDPEKNGKDLARLLGTNGSTGIKVEADAEAALARLRPHAILHCTSSFLPLVKDQLMLAVRAGVNVVSSSEELLMPDLQHAALAAQIDEAARNGGATVLGTGVNPGFAMDFMAVVASAVCQSVESARCVRTVDAGTRRLPLQRKVGAGLTVAEFKAQEKSGRFGHIGMRESVALIGRGLGFELDSITQTLEPVIAGQTTKTPFLTVEKGRVAGIHNIGIGRRGNDVLVALDLNMYVGAPQPRDEVILTGVPNVHLRFQGGVPGDQATAAILVNSVAQVVAAEPGLKTVLDLAPPRLVR